MNVLLSDKVLKKNEPSPKNDGMQKIETSNVIQNLVIAKKKIPGETPKSNKSSAVNLFANLANVVAVKSETPTNKDKSDNDKSKCNIFSCCKKKKQKVNPKYPNQKKEEKSFKDFTKKKSFKEIDVVVQSPKANQKPIEDLESDDLWNDSHDRSKDLLKSELSKIDEVDEQKIDIKHKPLQSSPKYYANNKLTIAGYMDQFMMPIKNFGKNFKYFEKYKKGFDKKIDEKKTKDNSFATSLSKNSVSIQSSGTNHSLSGSGIQKKNSNALVEKAKKLVRFDGQKKALDEQAQTDTEHTKRKAFDCADEIWPNKNKSEDNWPKNNEMKDHIIIEEKPNDFSTNTLNGNIDMPIQTNKEKKGQRISLEHLSINNEKNVVIMTNKEKANSRRNSAQFATNERIKTSSENRTSRRSSEQIPIINSPSDIRQQEKAERATSADINLTKKPSSGKIPKERVVSPDLGSKTTPRKKTRDKKESDQESNPLGTPREKKHKEKRHKDKKEKITSNDQEQMVTTERKKSNEEIGNTGRVSENKNQIEKKQVTTNSDKDSNGVVTSGEKRPREKRHKEKKTSKINIDAEPVVIMKTEKPVQEQKNIEVGQITAEGLEAEKCLNTSREKSTGRLEKVKRRTSRDKKYKSIKEQKSSNEQSKNSLNLQSKYPGEQLNDSMAEKLISDFEKPSEENINSKRSPRENQKNDTIKLDPLNNSQYLQENQYNENFYNNANQNCNIGDNKVVNFVNNITVNVTGALSYNGDTSSKQMAAKKDKLSKNIKKLNTSNGPTTRMVKARDISNSKRTDSPTKTDSTVKTDTMTSEIKFMETINEKYNPNTLCSDIDVEDLD